MKTLSKGTGRKKIMAALLTAFLAIGIPATAPHEAHAFSIGGLITGGIRAVQINNTVSKYNNSEEGRQALFEEMKKAYGVNNDPELNRLIDTVMSNLSKGVAAVDPSINEKPYNYFINNDQSFNAFCTLGHNMSINTGLFSLLTNEDEIAVVLAHEMGHGQKDHPAKGAKKSIMPMILASAAGDILTNIAANVWNNQGITKPMEKEADALAFEYITHTGYNPGACAAVWQRVMDKSGDVGDNFLTWLHGGADHPSNESRRDAYQKKIHEYSKNKVTVKGEEVFVNGKFFVKPAPTNGMSSAERANFVAGNLAAAYHNGHNTEEVTARAGVLSLGPQEIISITGDDENTYELIGRLNSIK